MIGRVYSISVITYQQIVRQPVYYIILLASAGLLFVASPFTLFSFGKELNMLKEVGLATIMLANIVIAILGADFVVSSEIEKQTFLLTLTKPLRRWEFIFGKFLGLIISLLMATVFLTVIFLIVYWLKDGASMIKDNYLSGRYLGLINASVWGDTYTFFRKEGLLFVQGSYAYYLQSTSIEAIAVMLSLFFSLPITAGGTALFFVLAQISSYIYISAGKNEGFIVPLTGKLLYAFIPNFTNFNVASQVVTASFISIKYLGLITLYAIIWNLIILGVTMAIFEKHEIR
jgi:ABC-type transport system involved in multi-copper enzyme maturation permease subunit